MLQQNIRFYQGRSMAGTFAPGDLLKIEAVPLVELRRGDVIVFRNGETGNEDAHLVHRVIRSDAGLTTMGDNNLSLDDRKVAESDLIGRVTCFERKGRLHRVWNGRLGMMRARVLHARLRAARAVKFFLRKPYRQLKKTGIAVKLWRPEIETIHFETPDGPLVKYIHEGKTVASCWTRTNRWWFLRPYDFVIGTKFKK